ncbi:MAG: TolC family protein, partial [Methylococcaceae bacterium]
IGGYGPGPDTPFRYQNTDVASFHAEMSKLFQNGIGASVGVLNTRIIQRNLSTVSRPNANNASVNLNINIPLLKNSGTTSASGRLNAARKQEEAATNDYKFFLTALANGAIGAYWDYRLAVDSLAIRETSRDRVMRITQEVNKFVTDPDPRKEAKLREQLSQVIFTAEGARTNKNRTVVDYKQFMEASKTYFALTLGVPPEKFNTIKMPSEEIPDGIIPTQVDLEKFRANWRKVAIENRLDLTAARLRQQAAEFIMKKAERDLYPQLDLSGSIGYQGLQEGNKFDDMWNAYGTNVNQPNWSTGLEFRYPLGNQVARGTYSSSTAQYRQAELSVYQKTREIDATIDVNVGLVERYVQAIDKAQHASQELKDALAAWKRTPLTDPSAILGMLQTEAQYTESLLTILNIRTEYAKLVADIRFKTGLLGKNGDSMEDYVINFSEVSKLPL